MKNPSEEKKNRRLMRKAIYTVSVTFIVLLGSGYAFMHEHANPAPVGTITIGISTKNTSPSMQIDSTDPIYNDLTDYLMNPDIYLGKLSFVNYAYDGWISSDKTTIRLSYRFGNIVMVSYRSNIIGSSWHYRVRDETPDDIAIKAIIAERLNVDTDED